MKHSIVGLPAVYTWQQAIDDISLKSLFIITLEGRWLGNALTKADAIMSARLHYSLTGGHSVH